MDSRKKNKQVNFNYVQGKVPPQAVELEKAVLGAILLESAAIYKVVDYLEPEVFYNDAHQKIYRAIQQMHNANKSIDLLTVKEKLVENEDLERVGGAYYLITLTRDVVSSAHIEEHCRVIFEKFVLREMAKVSMETLAFSFEDSTDCFGLLEQVKENYQKLDLRLSKLKHNSIDKAALSIVEKLNTGVALARKGEKNPNDIYTGLHEWDALNGPLFPGLYVVGARPSMGKGVHMTELIKSMTPQFSVGVVSAEMPTTQLLTRLACNVGGIDNFLWKKDKKYISDEELTQVSDAMSTVMSMNMHITEEKNIDIISSKIRFWVMEHKVRVVLIDFLTYLQVSEEKARYWTEKQSVNYILSVIVSLCKSLNVPIILYAQLNRELLKGGNKEPNLGHLKESGSIEEMAYQVSFLHRPEYYDPDATTDEFGESTKGLMYQIIAKHRDGAIGRIKYKALLPMSKLVPWQNELPSISSWQNKSLPQYNNQSLDSVLPPKDRNIGDFDENPTWDTDF